MNITDRIILVLPELSKDLLQFYDGMAILETPTLNNLSREYSQETGIPYHNAKDNIIKMSTKIIIEKFINE